MSVVVGSRLADRYVLLTRIGGGGMGSVWRALDEVLDRPVAVKVLAAQLSEDAEFRQRFRREARLAAQLDHPHITQVYDYGEVPENGQAVQYLVMELLSGHTLAERLREGPLPQREAVTIGADVAGALATAHRKGIVHRDITPGNIMLTPSGTKILDFGISTVAGDSTLTAAGRTLGTPAYLAPERVSGQQATAAVDVYSLAAVLVHAVTGRTPYQGSWSDQAHAHVHEPPPTLIDIPDDMAQLLRACLAKDPAARPGSDELARSLRSLSGVGAGAGTGLAEVHGGHRWLPAGAPATRVLPAQADPARQAAGPETRVLSTPPSGAAAAGRGAGPGRFLAWLALVAAAIFAALVVMNVLDDERTPSSQSPPTSTSSPSTPATSTPSEETPESTDSDLAAVVADIGAIGAAALADGDMTRQVAREISRGLNDAIDEAREGDFRGAERTLKELSDQLENRADDDDIAEDVYQEIDERLAILIDALDEAADDQD